MKQYIKYISLFLGFGFLLSNCTKKSDPSPSSSSESLSLAFTPSVGGSNFSFGATYTTTGGVRYNLSMYRFYVSNINLIKEDGSNYPITGKYLLVQPNVPTYDLGKVPVGNYKGLTFDVGIDSLTNHADPTKYDVGNPLAIQSPAIHWSWNTGYIFMMVEGTVDTTVAQNDVQTFGSFSKSMFFHIGTDPLRRKIDLSTSSFKVESGNAKIVYLVSDVNKLFHNVNLKSENQSHTMGSFNLAKRVADNIPTLFTIK